MEEDNRLIKYDGAKASGICYSSMILLLLIITLIGQTILSKVCDKSSVAYAIVNSLFSIISMIAIIITSSVINKENIFRKTSVKKFRIEYVVIALLISFGMFFGLGFINNIIVDLLKSLGLKTGGIDVPLNNVSEYIAFSITLALLPAIIEEAFFRGLFLNGLKGIAPIISALFCALFFALYHFSFTQLIYQFIYGIFLSLLTLKAKSIIPAILSHFINNFLVISLQYFKVEINLFNPIFIVTGILVLCGVLCILLLYPKVEGKSVKGEKANLFMPYGIIGVFITITMSILSLVL